MKSLTKTVVVLAVALGIACPPALAEPEFTLAKSEANLDLVGNQKVSGQVESIEGSAVTIKTNEGSTQTFQVDPKVISSLKLDQGSTVAINTSQLQTGRVSGLDRYTVKVKLDSGTTQTYIFPRESRRTLSFGNRVVVSGQQIVKAEDFQLTASQIRLSEMIASRVRAELIGGSETETTTAVTTTESIEPVEITTTESTYTSTPIGGSNYVGEEAVPALW